MRFASSPTPPAGAAPRWRQEFGVADAFGVRVEAAPAVDAEGRAFTRRRVANGPATTADRPGAGAVVVGLRTDEGRRRVAMVRSTRWAPEVVLWELPRGVADAEDADLAATGARELREETGLESVAPEVLGVIYPDSGLLANAVAVVLTHVTGTEYPADGEADEVALVDWEELPQLIRAGHLRDGISLSALALARCALDDDAPGGP